MSMYNAFWFLMMRVNKEEVPAVRECEPHLGERMHHKISASRFQRRNTLRDKFSRSLEHKWSSLSFAG